MSEQNLSLFDALHIAKEAEQKTAEFYADAAEKTTNPWGKRLFKELTEFERYHYQKLTDLEESLRQKGSYIHYEGRKPSISAVSEKIDNKDENPKSALDILALSMEIELEAEKRYKNLHQLTNDPEGKDMFKTLAAEEALHYKYVSNAYWSLSERGIWELPK
jgi:rubrerythrin